MNGSELIKRLAERLGRPQHEIRWLLKSSTGIFKKTLGVDSSFTIPKLGTFGTHMRHKRKAYNPHYKKFVVLPSKRVVFFHPSSVLKDRIKDIKGGNEE